VGCRKATHVQTISGILAIVLGVGAPPEWLKHDVRGYKVIGVPKGAVPPPLLKVVIVAGVPQLGNVTIAIETRGWVETVHHIYSSCGSPTATTQPSWPAQEIKEIVPTSGEGQSRRVMISKDMGGLGPRQRLM